MVLTKKFSEFVNVTPQTISDANEKMVGLENGANMQSTRYFEWDTAGRPPTPFNGLLGINTDLEQYEYWNSVDMEWIQLVNVDISGAKYILQQPDSNLPNAQAISALTTGILKSTTATGVVSISAPLTSIDSLTIAAHQFLITTGVSSYGTLGALTNGQLIIGSTGLAPALATLTAGSGVSIVNGAGTITISALNSGTVTSLTAGTGITLTPSTITTTGSIALTIPVAVTSGGTGLTSTTVNQLLYSSSNNVIAGLATANSAILRTNASGVPAFSASMTDGQLLIGSTGATPVIGSLTAGTNISITPGAGTITISATGGGSGTVTSVATNNGLTGGTITTSGTLGLDAIGDGELLANTSGGSLYPSGTTVSDLLDYVFSNVQGSILYRGASAWAALAPDTDTYVLTTHDVGADPTWEPGGGGSPSPWTFGGGTNSGIGGDGTTLTSGNYSLSYGGNSNTASANFTYAFGDGNVVQAAYCFGAGQGNTVGTISGTGYDTAFGGANVATGGYSIAIGYGNHATFPGAIALGNGCNSIATGAMAVGQGNYASGDFSFAFGQSVNSNNDYSFGFGNNLNISGFYSFGFGQNITTSDDYAIAMGQGSQANSDFSLAIGLNCISSNSHAWALGNGANAGYGGSVVWDLSTYGNVDNGVNQWVLSAASHHLYSGTNAALTLDEQATCITHAAIAEQGMQYNVPTTGFSYELPDSTAGVIFDPAGTLATGEFILPATPVDKQVVEVGFTQEISAFTLTPNGGQSLASPFTGVVTQKSGMRFIYDLGTTTWVTLDNAAALNQAGTISWEAQASLQSNVTGDGTSYVVQFTNVIENIGGSFDGTSTFTAPVDGSYMFLWQLDLTGLLAAHTLLNVNITGTGGIPGGASLTLNPIAIAVAGEIIVNGSAKLKLTAGQNVTITVIANGIAATKVVDVQTSSFFSGFLVN